MKPPQRTEAERIAGTLTFVEQCLLREGLVRVSWPFEVKARDRLVARGLAKKGWFSFRLTPLGLAVRAHLLSQDQTDER